MIAELEQSGESLETFCARRRIAPATLRWWRWRLPAPGAAPADACGVQLVGIDVVTPSRSEAASGSTVEIAVGGVSVRVAIGTDPTYVAALVVELGRRC